MIGGTGEKKTLRFVAKYADACNLFADPADASGTVQKLEVLREHCQNEGQLLRPLAQDDHVHGASRSCSGRRCASLSR